MSQMASGGAEKISYSRPEGGTVIWEKGRAHVPLMCKAKLLPLKSMSLQKVEEMEEALTQKEKMKTDRPQSVVPRPGTSRDRYPK